MERISSRQLNLIGAAYILDATLISVPSQMIDVAKQDAWLSYLYASVVVCFSIWILSKVMKRFPQQDLYQAMINRHAVLGRVLSSCFILFYFIVLARDIRMLVNFTNISLLPDTPLIVTGVMITLTVILIAKGGVEILGRMTENFFPVLIVVALILPVFLFTSYRWEYLLPVFEHGITPSLQGSWFAVAYVGEIVALPLIASGRTFTFRNAVYGLVIGVMILEVLAVQTILVLDTNLAARMIYPSYELVRQVRATDFLDRFDLPLVAIWLPTMLVKIAYSLHVVCHGLVRTIPKAQSQVIVVPVGVFALACAFWFFESPVQLMHLNRTWPVFALCVEVAIPVLLFLLLKPRKTLSAR